MKNKSYKSPIFSFPRFSRHLVIVRRLCNSTYIHAVYVVLCAIEVQCIAVETPSIFLNSKFIHFFSELSIQPELNSSLLPRHMTESGNVAGSPVDANVERASQSENNAVMGHSSANNASSSQHTSEMA